ncbi:stress-response A/B barrel domain-containing protein [Canna indica]|uniref:Stress-response A/B barrel domain-containing protein n=1 Tax=Canna indica TaxID=4628 RepID=A0AAQ3KV21_9LILI|nr:stress-response A/B barrel domain-containing protein [Canna indica]
MAEIKHLVLAKFKAEAAVEQLVQDMQKLVSQVDVVKDFEWGEDVLKNERLSHGFTHAFILTFASAQDLDTYIKHPNHVDYGIKFRASVDDILAIDFPTNIHNINYN